jgi:plastocyanin
MRRRTFLRTTGGAAALAAASAAVPGSAATIEDGPVEPAVVTAEGGTVEVAVGPGGEYVFEPGTAELLAITPGTTVEFVWESDFHNVVPRSQPDGANWEGEGDQDTTFNTGHTYSHAFDTEGTYEYVCTPHENLGMDGTIVVTDDPAAVTPAGTATPGGTGTPNDGGTDTPDNGTDTPDGGTNTTGGDGETHTVEMTDSLAFEPESLTVAPGDTVVWENTGSMGHSVTAYEDSIPDGADYWASGGFGSEQAARDAYSTAGSTADTGNVPGGEFWSRTVETGGTHEYFCIPHETGQMVGRIEVSAGGDPGGGDGSLPIGVPGLILGGLGIAVSSFLAGVYYGGKREGAARNTAALAGIGVIALGLVLVVAIVARLLIAG